MPVVLAEHGSYGAYRRHLREKSLVCDACKAFMAEKRAAKSTSAENRPAREAERAAKRATTAPKPPPDVPLTDEGHISRLEVLKEQLEVSRSTIAQLRQSDPSRVYLLMREQRETLREIAEIQGNGQAKGVTLGDQLAEARARRTADAAAAASS